MYVDRNGMEIRNILKTTRVQHPQAKRDPASNVTAGESMYKAHIGISESDCVSSRTQSSSKHTNSSFPEPRSYHTSIERLVSFIRRRGPNWAEKKAVRIAEGWVDVTDGADWSGRRESATAEGRNDRGRAEENSHSYQIRASLCFSLFLSLLCKSPLVANGRRWSHSRADGWMDGWMKSIYVVSIWVYTLKYLDINLHLSEHWNETNHNLAWSYSIQDQPFSNDSNKQIDNTHDLQCKKAYQYNYLQKPSTIGPCT